MNLPHVHLAIIQPMGYMHSLGFLDQARYFRHQFRRMGATVTVSKNRLREDALNFVFGAHLGFPVDGQQRHACVFVNLEQLGHGGAQVAPAYLALLRRSAVVDYDAANVAAYAEDPADVPVVPFLYAPYLDCGERLPLEQRPIDLLFFGSLNPRRQAFLAQVEAAGVQVSRFDNPVYGPERDHFIRQSKAVLNCHFYDSSRFEQARAFQCLSLGTPVISERRANTLAPAGFDEAMFWLEDGQIGPFFSDHFRQPAFFDTARAKLAAFRQTDPMEAYADLLAFAAGFHQAWGQTRAQGPWRPESLSATLALGGYRSGWLNVAPEADPQADALLDLTRPLTLPLTLLGPAGAPIELKAASLSQIELDATALPLAAHHAVLANALALLTEEGSLTLDLPSAAAQTGEAPQLPAEGQAWCRSVAEFWRHGQLDHRFTVTDQRLQSWPSAVTGGAPQTRARVQLRKVVVTLGERSLARSFCPDFGDLPTDLAEGVADTALADAPTAPTLVAADRPELTVVCVSYKRYVQIPVLIHSFLSQTVQSYKLLILHDGPDERMRLLLEPYRLQYPGKIEVVFTEQRYNDYGHSLRDMGIRMVDTPYLLITNDDNYYAPKFVEFMVPPMKARQADIAMCDMIHSHDHPGCRPQPSYRPFETRPARGSVDIGCFIARTDWAQRVGFRDKSHDGDATYFEDLLACAEKPTVLKVERTLFVHN